jgi:DNA replication licensing factor MCM5
MAGFDDAGVFFSDNFGSEDQNDDNQISRQQVKKRLKDFIRQFHEGNFTYTYRYTLYIGWSSQKLKC